MSQQPFASNEAPDSLWQEGLEQLAIDPSQLQLEAWKRYVDLLARWNKTYNLTAVRKVRDMIPLHILDSLSVATYLHGTTCLDVGSGAGLPTIPLAILQPERQFTALDTNGKKTRFMRQAVIELGLENVSVVQSRIESWKPEKRFDAIISRAFSSVADFVALSSIHLAPGGTLYAMKGQYPASELASLPSGFVLIASHQLKVPFVDGERHLLEIRYEGQNS